MASKPLHFPLDISKLKFVLQVLRQYKFPEAKWFDFGLNLDMPYHTLKAIESANKGDSSNCLRECLAKWLTEGSDRTLVWQTLANALREMNVLSVSNNIRKTMADPVSELLQCYIGRLAQVVLTEESVDLLHTEGLISKDTLTEVKSCGCSLVGDPMLLILSAVAEDHSKLCTLTSILMKSKEAVSLASDIIMEYGKSFPSAVTVMPSCQQASTSPSSRSGQLQDSSSETQVTTNTDATAQEIMVHPGYKAEFDRMGDMLGTLIHNIVPLIEAAIPSVNDLKIYIGRCRRDLKLRLKAANSFDDVMEVIEDECSITDVALLETIVNKYSIQDAGDMILAYQTHLDEFCENKLTMFCNRQLKRLSSSLLTCETIKFVLEWKPSEHSFSSIKALLWKTFKDNQVKVVVIDKWNSIMLTCYAPHYLMESLLVTARDNVDMLKEMGLISLTIGYYTVYDKRAIDEEVKSLMKKLEMVESERDDLLEENAKLKGVSYQGGEVDESNKSSIQSSESRKQSSKNKMAKAMQMEIDHLRLSLQSKIGVEKVLIEREKEIEQLQEKISLLNIQHTSIPVKPSEFKHKKQYYQQQIDGNLIDDMELEIELATEQDWRPVDRHRNEEGRGGGSRERYSAEMRGKKRISGERMSREFGQQNDRMGQHYNDRGGYNNQNRFQGDRRRYQGDRDQYQGDQGRYQDKQQGGYGGGGANYQNEQDRYHNDKRYQGYYQDDPHYQDHPRYRDNPRYCDDQSDSYQRGRDDYWHRYYTKKQQSQLEIEPLVKPSSTKSLIDDTEIKTATQRLAESLSTMNQSDSHELLDYLFWLLQSSDASLPTESLGRFSIKFEPGIPATPSGFKLELIVEPLHGKTFTVYPEVFATDTIEKLKLDVQKGYKIPKECQYWAIGSQLAEDDQTVADLKLTEDTAVYLYVQHPHKVKVYKNAMMQRPK